MDELEQVLLDFPKKASPLDITWTEANKPNAAAFIVGKDVFIFPLAGGMLEIKGGEWIGDAAPFCD